MAEVVAAAKPQKRPLGDENAGADDAPDASKKARVAAAEAESVELTKEVKKAAQTFQTVANKHAPGWKPQKGENAAELVKRVAKETRNGIPLIAQAVVKELDSKFTRKWSAGKVRNAIKRGLEHVPAAAFVVAGAPPKKKEKEGYVAGKIDVRRVGKDTWHRFDSEDAATADKEHCGASSQVILNRALRNVRANPADTKFATQRGFEVRDVTDALRCATATNKVVRGYHEPLIAHADRNYTSTGDRLVAEAERKKKESKDEASRVAADKEKREVDFVIRCAEFGLAVVAAPPLPDGATDADRERLEDEALAKLYGH